MSSLVLPNKELADRIFFTVIVLQIIALAFILFGPRGDEQKWIREVLLFLLYFTGVPVVATLLVVVLQKVGPRRSKPVDAGNPPPA